MTADATFREAVVFGAGALGSYLGARLSGRLSVTLVGRADHVRAVKKDGLRVRAGNADECARLRAEERCPELGVRTLVVVAVKLPDIRAAAEALLPRLRSDTTLLVVQNGIDPDRMLADALAGAEYAGLARAVVGIGCTFEAPGRIAYWGGGLTFGPGDAEDRLADLFADCGVTVKRVDDLRPAVWRKFAVNCVANPLTALSGRRNSEIITPELEPLRRMIVDEVAAVAAAEGVTLDDDLAEYVDGALAKSQNVNSMLQDVQRGRPTEIDGLNAEAARRARAHGIDAPANRALAELVRLRVAANGRKEST